MKSLTRKIGVWGVLLNLAPGLLLWAGEAAPPTIQTVVLHPAALPPLRIDFNYSYNNALPPFEKELALPGKELARGFIPTVPPTPLLRNISDHELYLNLDHLPDFTAGKLATYRSVYNGHVLFRALRVSTIRAALEIPYTVSLNTYEHGCQGWLNVQSGWTGEFAVGGHTWSLGIVDNLDGEIGGEDRLYLQRSQPGQAGRMLAVGAVPQTLFLDGHAFDLDFRFQPGATGAVLEVTFTETNLPLGKLNIAAQRCSCFRLGSERIAVILDAADGTASLPAGTFRIETCLLDEIPGRFRQPAFIRCDRTVAIQAGQTASLELGPPLRNTVQVTRDRDLLRLTYQLLGRAGEQYEYYDWEDRPRFSVYRGPVRMGGGTLPFG